MQQTQHSTTHALSLEEKNMPKTHNLQKSFRERYARQKFQKKKKAAKNYKVVVGWWGKLAGGGEGRREGTGTSYDLNSCTSKKRIDCW